MISIVIPLYNEQDSLKILTEKINKVFQKIEENKEIIFIDDGSTDGSWAELLSIKKQNKAISIIRLRRNFGKTYALQAGFKNAQGEVIITMDADLQDNPEEIPKFLDKINEGFDVVSGWRYARKDPFNKKFPSKIYNFLIRLFFKTKLHDINCGLKAYKATAIKSIKLYGELHRVIPILAGFYGFSVSEVKVLHNPRRYGKSKYNWQRYLKGFLDLLSTFIKMKYFEKPMYLFGALGLLLSLVGMSGLIYLSILWLMGLGPIGNRPLLLFSILFVISGIQLFSFGLLAELINSNGKKDDLSTIIAEVK